MKNRFEERSAILASIANVHNAENPIGDVIWDFQDLMELFQERLLIQGH